MILTVTNMFVRTAMKREKHISIDEYRKLAANKKSTKRSRSELELELLAQINRLKLPKPEEEYKFLKDRRFRFDFAYPEYRIAIEVQGGIWCKGGHSSGKGIIRDCEKYNLAQLNGWTLLLFTADSVHSGEAVRVISMLLSDCQFHNTVKKAWIND